MTKYTYILTLGAAALLLSNCGKPEPTVLEFNDSYTTTPPTPGERDTPPAVDVLTPYIYFTDNQPRITVTRTIQDDESLAVESPIAERTVTIKNNVKQAKDQTYDLELMTKENTPKLYDKVIKGNSVLLPSSAYHLSATSITIKQGSKVAEEPIRITFNKDEFVKLDKSKEYILPLVIKKPEGAEAIPGNYYALTVTLEDIEKIISGDNVTGSTHMPSDAEILEGLTLSAGNNEGLLPRLTDRSLGGDYWWTPSGPESWLMLGFEKRLIKAIIIDQQSYYKLSGVFVEAANAEGGPFYPQGECRFNGNEPRVVITFNTPIKVNRLRLHGFDNSSGYVALTEVRVAAVK